MVTFAISTRNGIDPGTAVQARRTQRPRQGLHKPTVGRWPIHSKLYKCSQLSARMWNEPRLEKLEKLPGLYETDQVPAADKIIHEHFFLGGCDWYMAEYGPPDRIFFGYAILNDDLENAEWGYISFDELRSVNVRGVQVDRDLDWRPCKASEVQRIVQSAGL